MKRIILIILIFIKFQAFSQYVMDEKLASPDWATLIRACVGNSTINYIEEFTAGEIIIRGETVAQPEYSMVLGENTSNPIEIPMQKGVLNAGGFLARLNSNGIPVWAKFMDGWFTIGETYLDQSNDKLYLSVTPKSSTGNFYYDQTEHVISSSYTAQFCLIIKYSTGEFIKLLTFPQASRYVFSPQKKFVIFSPMVQYSPYYDTRLIEKIGFLDENDNIYKYQSTFNNQPKGTSQTTLFYNPFKNTWWFFSLPDANFTYASEISLSGDSLVFSPVYHNKLPKPKYGEQYLSLIFLSEKNFLINSRIKIHEFPYKNIIRTDTSGKEIWRLNFHESNLTDNIRLALDKDQNIWAYLNYFFYYDKITHKPSGKSWLISGAGNTGLFNHATILKIDINTGEPLFALINGYGSRNDGSVPAIFINKNNQLYLSSPFYSLIMFPDKSGNYYYSLFSAKCDNNMMPSNQVIVNRYSLDGLIYRSYTSAVKEIEDQISNRFEVYPNPSDGRISISSATPANFQIYDLTGRRIFAFRSTENITNLELKLEKGIYLIKNIENGQTEKLIIQ